MEQQLKMQRAAHQQKRALETLKVPAGQVFKMVPATQQGEFVFTAGATDVFMHLFRINVTLSDAPSVNNYKSCTNTNERKLDDCVP
jgi:hypothetical protein